MSRHGRLAKNIGTDKGYDSGELLHTLETRQIEPHIAIRDVKRDHVAMPHHQQAAHDAHVRIQARRDEAGYQLSQRCRKKVEECFGWLKTIARQARLRHVRRWKIQQQLELSGAAFNVIQMRKLGPVPLSNTYAPPRITRNSPELLNTTLR